MWKRSLALTLPRKVELERTELRYALQPKALLPGNRIAFLRDGTESYPAMLEAIAGATVHVHLESYIFNSDRTGRRFGEALVERAKAGVTVRLLYDAVGSLDLDGGFLRELTAGGVKVVAYRPFSWKSGLGLNHRDHRKILVIDGKIGFTGGLNIGDEYAGLEEGGGGWHDLHARVEGPAVGELARLFRKTWLASGGDRFPQNEEPSVESVVTEDSAFAVAIGNEEIRRRRTIRQYYFHAMRRARHTIRIMNAYFIPDRGIRRILANAVKRGVEVRVIVPEVTDIRSVQLAGQHVFGNLLRAGVRIFEWPDRMLHAKAAAVDAVWATIGSYNLDARSLFHNLEVILCVVDQHFGAGLDAQLVADSEKSKEIKLEEWATRPFWRKIAEWFFYQFRHWL